MKNRNELGTYLTSLGLVGKGVEIGTFKGEFARQILNTWEGILYMVDPWRELTEGYIDISNHANHPTAYLETMQSLRGFEDRGIMIRALSEQAVDLFEDESLDFVYIDGNHAYDYVKQDIELWYPKVKKGGIVSGHDYILWFGDGTKKGWYQDSNWDINQKDKHLYNLEGGYIGVFGVNTAVDEWGVENNYEILLTTHDPANKSWYFIK